MTDADRLTVCRAALERVARLDVGPAPFHGTYTPSGHVRETALVGLAQITLMDCWPDEGTYPEPRP